MRRVLAAVMLIAVIAVIAVVAMIVRRDHTSTPARPQPSRALLTAAEREQLRQQILAGNRWLAQGALDASSASAAAAPVDAGVQASPGDVEAADASPDE